MAHSSKFKKRSSTQGLTLLGLLFFLTSGCEMVQELRGSNIIEVDETPVSTPATHSCADPRPKICTMRYEPVCAVMASGLITTYPSACNACADITVSGWRPEPCEEL